MYIRVLYTTNGSINQSNLSISLPNMIGPCDIDHYLPLGSVNFFCDFLQSFPGSGHFLSESFSCFQCLTHTVDVEERSREGSEGTRELWGGEGSEDVMEGNEDVVGESEK